VVNSIRNFDTISGEDGGKAPFSPVAQEGTGTGTVYQAVGRTEVAGLREHV
jgi:hypothetical protein